MSSIMRGVVYETWMTYRTVWRRRPYYVPMLFVGVLLIAYGIAGTALRQPAAIAFVPGLLLVMLHHFLVVKAAADE